MEGEADRFAAEFLMPEREIRSDLRPPLTIARLAALKPYWKVSMAALARRAWNVGTIDQNRYRRLFTELSGCSVIAGPSRARFQPRRQRLRAPSLTPTSVTCPTRWATSLRLGG